MQTITPEIAVEICRRINQPMYCTNPFWLAENCLWEEKNGELLIWLDCPSCHCIHLLLPPKKLANIQGQFIELVSPEELEHLKSTGVNYASDSLLGHEYYYRTANMIEMRGQAMASFRRSVNYFKRTYKYKLFYTYDRAKVEEFVRTWAKNKDLQGYSQDMRDTFWREARNCEAYVKLAETIPAQGIYVEIDGELAGFAMTTSPFPNIFVALQQKVKTQFKGLSRFLYHEKCKMNSDKEFFTAGFDDTPGLREFKDSLHPSKVVRFQLVKLGSA